MSTETATRTTAEVANRLTALCREGKHDDAISELYAENIQSYEPEAAPAPTLIEGKANVIQKSAQWAESVQEVHSSRISEPIVADNHFTIAFDMDISFKDGKRMNMSELGVYQVNNGQITREDFFYRTQ